MKAWVARFSVETVAHTGTGAFSEIGGAKVNTAVFAIRGERDVLSRENAIGAYSRLVKEDDKQAAFERALVDGSNTYRAQQGKFRAIPDAPWVYWAPSHITQLFETLQPLSSVATPKQGLATADNTRFLRFWWEVGLGRVDLSCDSCGGSSSRASRWFPHTKGV